MIRMLMFTLLLSSVSSVWAQEKLSPAEGKLMLNDGMRLWQKRDVKESLDEALSKFNLALTAMPEDIDLLTHMARGYFLLGDYYTMDSGEKKMYLERAKDFGLQGLRTNKEFKKAEEKDGLEKALKHITKKEVAALYWAAASLGKWSKANGVFSSLKYKSDILAMIGKVEELDPTFFHGAVPRYWGGFYAVAPGIAGGDMKKSKKKFEEAIKVAPESLTTQVLFAELYWTKEDNKKEFKKILMDVVKAEDGPEDIAPENRMEKRKAEVMLEKVEDYF